MVVLGAQADCSDAGTARNQKRQLARRRKEAQEDARREAQHSTAHLAVGPFKQR